MKILKYIAVLYVILKVVIFLVGVIPVFLINFSMEYPKEWYEMLLNKFFWKKRVKTVRYYI
jgi:hypothetical protein